MLGISDKLPRTIVGSNAFPDLVSIASKIFQAIGFRVDAEEVQHADGRVVVFHIPPRPRGKAYHFEGSYLMRSGEELVPMSEDQLRKIYTEGQPSWLDAIAVKSLDGQDVIQLLDTQTFFDLLGLPYPTEQKVVLERLKSEKLVEHFDDGYAVLNIGALLLAKSLRKFESIQRKAARVDVYSGNSKLNTLSDLTGERGYAVGIQVLVQFVMGKLP